MSDYVTLTDADFDAKTSKGNWIIDFWAPWCGPCRVVGPIIEGLAVEYKGKVHIGKVNVDENQATAMKFEIMSIPDVLFFKNGEKVDHILGSSSKETYAAKIKEAFGV